MLVCFCLSVRDLEQLSLLCYMQLAKLAYSAKYNKVFDAKKRQLDDKKMIRQTNLQGRDDKKMIR